MKMKLWMVLVALSMAPLTVCSQTDAIQKIRNHYQKIEKWISECEEQQECNLYVNQLIVNENNASWRGSGGYKKVIKFWYEDDPKNCDECGENGLNVLQMIMIDQFYPTSKQHTELLFFESQLIFAYQSTEGEYGNDQFRFYFENGQLIRYMNGSEIRSLDQHGTEMLDTTKQIAEYAIQLFLTSMK